MRQLSQGGPETGRQRSLSFTQERARKVAFSEHPAALQFPLRAF